jgi:hypothetical protein
MHITNTIRLSVLTLTAFAAASCGDVVRTGRSPVMLNVNTLEASAGNSSELSGTLQSDVVVTSPSPCAAASPCLFADNGSVVLAVNMKDVTVTPTTNNIVTVTRYHVQYRRADGRNVQGIDVPFGFDGAITTTIEPGNTTTATFEIVRHAAKQEAPLAALAHNPAIISTIADVTFFGRDTVGNELSATGSILINFGNFGDQ